MAVSSSPPVLLPGAVTVAVVVFSIAVMIECWFELG